MSITNSVLRMGLIGLLLGLGPECGVAAPAADSTILAEEDLKDFEEDAWTGRPIPPQERVFVEIVQKAQKAYAGGSDKDTVRNSRKAALESFRQQKFENWIGLLSHMPDDGGDGNISIRITIAPDVTLETDFNITPSDPIYSVAHPLEYGTIVQVSGSFLLDHQNKDYFKETSLTETGGLEDPSWKVLLNSFKPLN